MAKVLSFAKTGTWCFAHSNWKEEKKKHIVQVLFLSVSLFLTQPELNKHLLKLIETMFKKMLSYSMGLMRRLTNKGV